MQNLSKTHIIITLLVIAAIGWLLFSKKNVNPDVTVPTPTAQEPSPVIEWPSNEVKKEGITESTKQYSINAAYPVTKDERITLQLKSFIEDQISQFKKDISWANEGDDIAPAQSQSLSLDIDYRNDRGGKADTYVFTVLTYTGGAHGLQVTKTFSFDILGKLIQLPDLFKNGEAGLKTIAPLVIKDLMGRSISDSTWISEGAAAKIENYQNFTISDNGVTFIFDPYQVAPYSAGAQNVTVPLAGFKSIANPAIF